MGNYYVYNMISEQYLINHASDRCHDLWADDYRHSDSCISSGTLNYIEHFIGVQLDSDPPTVLHISEITISMAKAVALYTMNEQPCMVYPCITETDGEMTWWCPDFSRGEPMDYSWERLMNLRGNI